MDTAVAIVKTGAVWVALVTMVLSLFLSYTAGLDARSAVRSAAFAAATALGRDWNCRATGTDWASAETAAAEAAGDRLAANKRLIVTDFALTADTATCTVLASLQIVPVSAGRWWWTGPAHAVACAPTRSTGLPLPTVCGQRA
ncbi:MAG: hypothetical protein F4X74_10590 [Acidimicrobiia bacterium]|nr:hypothetical protein [Acidimicrobiia bacterium]